MRDMSSASVGRIGLDLIVNRNNFDRQMQGIQGLAKKAGLALAAAFSVKKLVDFGKECIELGSDLAEVQNVVDVTFPAMSKQVDEFAKSAAASFGLSETMAKRFTGTFGAMAKAFGFSEKEAYAMSTTLTGLAGDVASFYNLSQDEAYTKLKSVFTGETESLKDLGVVMTQTALDAYALANGFGKTTAKMSEMEKVALRYRFVQDQLNASAGDFLRTSDSWANQVRLLSLQFDSLKATIGQGLINVLTPVIRVINTIIGKLMTLANAFKAFTEMITGKKVDGAAGGMKATAGAAEEAAEATEDVADATTAAGKAASKSAKKLKGLYSFDKVNVVNKNTSSGGGGGSSAGGFAAESIDMGAPITEAFEETDSRLQKIKNRFKELKDLVKQGFKAGQGESWTARLDDIKTKADGIKESILNIFTAPEVIGSVNAYVDAVSYNLGRAAGSAASIGLTIAQNLIGGISQYLTGNEERIKKHITDMFDIGAEISNLIGDFKESFAYVFEAFGDENGQELTANLIGIFSDAFMGVLDLGARLIRDILNVIISPFVENKEQFRAALDGFLGVLADVCGTIKDTIDQTFDKLRTVYDEHIKPFFDSVADGLGSLAEKFLTFWNGQVQPVLDNLAKKVDEVFKSRIQPALDNAAELIGMIADALKLFWEEVLQPLIGWIIDNVLPVLLPIFEGLYQTFIRFVGQIADLINGLITSIKGIIDFVVGIFTGDWERAWQGVKEIFTGAFEQIKAVLGDALKFIQAGVKTNLSAIQGSISNVLSCIKSGWNATWTAMKQAVINIFNDIWSGIKNVINNIIGGIEKMANSVIDGINSMISALNRLKFSAPDWVPVIGGKSFNLNIPAIGNISIPKLAQGAYVAKNTPQLAMIGDNLHQGEIVAPEDKMYEVCYQAMSDALKQLVTALRVTRTQNDPVKITLILKADQDFVRNLKFELDQESSRTGIDFEVVTG